MLREVSLGEVLTWGQWIKVAGLGVVFVASIYLLMEFFDIIRSKL